MSDTPETAASLRLPVGRSPVGRALLVAPAIGSLLIFGSPFSSGLPWMPAGAGSTLLAAGVVLTLLGVLFLVLRDGQNLLGVELTPGHVVVESQSQLVRLPWSFIRAFDDRSAECVQLHLRGDSPLRGPLSLVTRDEPTRVAVLQLLDDHRVSRVDA